MNKTTDDLLSQLDANKASLPEYLQDASDIFVQPDIKEFWNKMIEKSHRSKSDIINKSDFNYKYFYDVINGRKLPTQDKVIRLCLAMKLTIEDCQQALNISGKAKLHPKIKRDSIILYALRNRWPVSKCSSALVKYGEEELK